MNAIIYRRLELKDINRFTELRKLQLIEEGAEAAVDITNQLLDYCNRHLSDGSFISWVAVDDDEIIATSGMSFIEKPPYYSNPTGRIGLLSSMYTTPAYRRNGIAKKLLGLVVKEAKENGCGVIHLTASGMGAHLYQDFGFERRNNFFQYKINPSRQ